MTDAGFVLAGYAVVAGGVVAYGVALLRRLAMAQRRAAAMVVEAQRRGESTPSSAGIDIPETVP